VAGLPGHRGIRPARGRAAQARPLCPAHLHPPGIGGHIRPGGPLPLQLRARSRHLVMPVLFWTIYACGLRASEARLLRPGDVDTSAGVLQVRDARGGKDRQVPVSGPLRERPRLPRASCRAARLGLVLPWQQRRPAADAGERLQELPPLPLAGPHLPRAAVCGSEDPLGKVADPEGAPQVGLPLLNSSCATPARGHCRRRGGRARIVATAGCWHRPMLADARWEPVMAVLTSNGVSAEPCREGRDDDFAYPGPIKASGSAAWRDCDSPHRMHGAGSGQRPAVRPCRGRPRYRRH
jgi:hypothetical protein